MAAVEAFGQGLGTVRNHFTAVALGALVLCAGTAYADEPAPYVTAPNSASATEAVQPLSGKDAYRALFAALRASNWSEAKLRAMALDGKDPVRAVALSELYTARNSPRVEMFDLLDLLNKASWLPDADQLGRLAKKRGAELLPNGPQTRRLMWMGSTPKRSTAPTTRDDQAALALVAAIQPYIQNDNPAGAEALIGSQESGLSADGVAEVRQRIAWSYYIENDDANARRLASRVLESGSRNDWTVQAHWTIGLSAWRQKDPRGAAVSFEQVASRASNDDMRAAGAYWAARAWMNAGYPAKVAALMKVAAQKDDTFYGMLARETLGITAPLPTRTADAAALREVNREPAIKAAVALREIGEDDLADELLKRQAELGGAREYGAVLAVAGDLNMPETQLWLAHHGPAGYRADGFDRFPRPQWMPDGGWRVDPALVFAHTLQESNFRAHVVSPAGARGLMQVMPGTAREVSGSPDRLFVPSTNMEYGQRYLEQLSRMQATGGLLPKIMAAYNAGPTPVARWNSEVRDGGDPLLFMESLPYYETRAYVNIVMRNYWMYQLRDSGKAEAMTAMAQGKWPAFPAMRGGKVTQVSYRITR